MKTGTSMTSHESPERKRRRRKRRERERKAGTTGGPVTTRIATPEELAALRAEKPNQDYRPSWATAPTRTELASRKRRGAA